MVTFILGYAGSGRTELARRIVAKQKFDDDFLEDRSKHESLIDALKQGEDCVVIEVAYCEDEERQEIVQEIKNAVPHAKIRWICFDREEIEIANANCGARKNKADPDGHIWINENRIRPDYSYPEGAIVLKVWNDAD